MTGKFCDCNRNRTLRCNVGCSHEQRAGGTVRLHRSQQSAAVYLPPYLAAVHLPPSAFMPLWGRYNCPPASCGVTDTTNKRPPTPEILTAHKRLQTPLHSATRGDRRADEAVRAAAHTDAMPHTAGRSHLKTLDIRVVREHTHHLLEAAFHVRPR
jgi:hypothetical protein